MTGRVIIERSDIMNKKEVNIMIKPYVKPSRRSATWQILNTLIPYFAIIVGMYFMISNGISYFLVLPVGFLGSLFLVRIFIFFHDCTHSSFLKSRKWMNFWGHVFGTLVFTPYNQWKKEHIEHHRTVGNIDKRGVGDVWTMTVDEYKSASFWKKLGYRLYRNPIILFIIGPVYLFLINQRLPFKTKKKKEWASLLITNGFILAIILTVSFTIGFKYYLMIQVPIIFFASSMGVWLFFVQHQYEDVYWAENGEWNIFDAALKGSSVYKLPIILDWFTGSIGYHNIHHLNAKIPNYRLRGLFKSKKELQKSKIINLYQSIKLAKLFLYDVKEKRLITYRKYRKAYR